MNRRNALGIMALLALSACIVNLSFEMKKPLALQSTAAGNISQNVLVDLSQYKEITDHKDQLKSLDLDYAEAIVTHVNPANTATKVTGTLKLRKSLTTPAANDVVVGNFQDFSIAVVGATKRLNGTPELDAFLLSQLHEQGTFFAVVEGTVDGVADLTIDISLHASIGYDTGLF